MNERDVVRAYRTASEALGEAPREATRAAILAAAARAVRAKPRAADRMRRWRMPLAAAGVLISTIAVLVATRTERQAPEIASAPAETTAQPSADIYAPEPAAAAPDAAPPAPVKPAPIARTPQAQPPPAVLGAAAPPNRLDALDKNVRASAAAAPTSPPAAADVVASGELAPPQWIERIVALRAAGRDEEADREVERFRQRHPQVRLPPAALRKANER